MSRPIQLQVQTSVPMGKYVVEDAKSLFAVSGKNNPRPREHQKNGPWLGSLRWVTSASSATIAFSAVATTTSNPSWTSMRRTKRQCGIDGKQSGVRRQG